MANKGSSFEREICKKLSLWWTNTQNDDIFWRTSGSGARATTRAKKGLGTFGQAGDIQAVNPIGQPFINIFTTELKRGYPTATLSNIFDASPNVKHQEITKFITQAEASRKQANSLSWLIIHKRDRRRTTVILPLVIASLFIDNVNLINGLIWNSPPGVPDILQISFVNFLCRISPQAIIKKNIELGFNNNA